MNRAKIGYRLKKLRYNRMETLETVASACGITEQSLSHYENGQRTPRDEVKKRLAAYFGRSVEDIFYAD